MLLAVVVVAGPSELEHVPPLLMKASRTVEADWLDDPHANERNSNGAKSADVKNLDFVVVMKFRLAGNRLATNSRSKSGSLSIN